MCLPHVALHLGTASMVLPWWMAQVLVGQLRADTWSVLLTFHWPKQVTCSNPGAWGGGDALPQESWGRKQRERAAGKPWSLGAPTCRPCLRCHLSSRTGAVPLAPRGQGALPPLMSTRRGSPRKMTLPQMSRAGLRKAWRRQRWLQEQVSRSQRARLKILAPALVMGSC